MHRACLIIVALSLTHCTRDETVAAYGGADRVWILAELGNQRVGTPITLTFPGLGRIAGQGPCNTYTAKMLAPYPWFETANIVRTRTNCADLAFEDQYVEALAGMTQSEVSGSTLVLRNDAGREMVFVARD
ncbi:META domain-containing protein [Sedimentitalea todarodis]|uniref:META domain-containing protein n=1 Tax=Sedimentitalea todarodis TaxID=1631240 RepID=A0ABU3V9M2_9RHOB|nr:META domain-containing protein [Sedimentitalea todarodis]MDU9002788.1 META domain-containing protein [Sedimentitalea todarodis]